MATLLLKIGKRELQKCTFNRKEALFTPSDTATGYLSCALHREPEVSDLIKYRRVWIASLVG